MSCTVLSTLTLLLTFQRISTVQDAKVQYYKEIMKESTNTAPKPSPRINLEFVKGAKQTHTQHYGTFDFIVVGAGSTGNVIATRLSEIQGWSILLLEAGGEENDFTDIPHGFNWSGPPPDIDWGYETVPQNRTCLSDPQRKCQYLRGKTIGGCSTINGMHYVRGNRKDYDTWADMGNTKWSFEEVLPYFKKSENSQIDGDDGYHGKGGYLNVQYTKPEIDTYPVLVEAYKEMGRKVVDYNGKTQLGVSKTQVNIKSGKRQSTGRAFLENARFRDNLNVTTQALVTRIIIDKKNKSVQGVEFVKGDKKFKAIVNKEVIVSAGAFNSPQLLMLSGIGPAQHLKEVGIETIVDSPAVGKNLTEHPNLNVNFRMNHSVTEPSEEEQIKELINNGTGPLSRPGTTGAIMFEHLDNYPSDDSVPTVEFLYSVSKNFLSFMVLLQHPISRGEIKLKSHSPIDHPLIDLNIFSDPEGLDAKHLLKGRDFVLHNLTQTQAFKKLNLTHLPPKICKEFAEKSTEYWDCYLGHEVDWFGHAFGSTRMGRNKNESVVDQFLRVHGVKGLRVADVGVIPSTMSGHLNAVAIMIGERVSDMIKEQHGIVTGRNNSGRMVKSAFSVVALSLAVVSYFTFILC